MSNPGKPTGPRSLFQKIWDGHVVSDLGNGVSLVAIDRIFLHERTGSIALKSLRESGRPVADPSRVFCTMDHIVDTFPGRGDETRMPGGTRLHRRDTRGRTRQQASTSSTYATPTRASFM